MRIKDAIIVGVVLGIIFWIVTLVTGFTKMNAVIVGGTTSIISIFICLAYMFVDKVLDWIFAPKSDRQ